MDDFQLRLGYQFRDNRLLKLALTHPSCSRHQVGPPADNQRLEFLGDAVLQLAVTEKLFELFPEVDEGVLTKLRSRLVSREHLARCARTLKIGPILRMGPGEERNAGRERDSNLADAWEAVLGAVHLDGGWEKARTLIDSHFAASLQELRTGEAPDEHNAKGRLQELLQKGGGGTPVYDCVESTGQAHDRNYRVILRWQGQELGEGQGKSKRAAETEAARAALAQHFSKESAEK